MMMFIITILCYMMGFVFIILPYVFIELHYFYFELAGGIICIFPAIYLLYKMWDEDTLIQTDSIPRWKQLIYYLRRDANAVQLLGERAFAGESFIDVPFIGLMEFLGRDCVYTFGNKKTVFGLENINYSPDPRYGNFTYCLWKLGLSNSTEVKMILDENNSEPEIIELREKVYNNICDWIDPIDKLNKGFQEYNGKEIDFKPTEKEEKNMHEKALEFIEEKFN